MGLKKVFQTNGSGGVLMYADNNDRVIRVVYLFIDFGSLLIYGKAVLV